MERQRLHGTFETMPETGEERIKAIRRVVEEKQYAKIDGQMADLFTCSAIVQVHDALNEANQTKYRGLSYKKMGQIALQLLKNRP